MDLVTPKPLEVDEFLTSVSNFSVQDKYFKWENYLRTLKQSDSSFYQAALQKFLQHFPYNHTYWGQIVELVLKVPKVGKGNAVRFYQLALAQNTRSITLWQNYLVWLKKQICRSDPGYLKKQHDKAIKIIGNHFKAGFLFQDAFNLHEAAGAKYLIMKKAMVSPLQQLDMLYDMAASWLDSTEELPLQSLISISNQESITAQNEPELRKILKAELRKLYQPSKKHVQQREEWEEKIGDSDEYYPYGGKIEVWRGYLAWMKNSGNPQFVGPLYERALIVNCDNESLWEQYFLVLQNESNYQRALYLFRAHSVFFRSFSQELTYYWVELEQRESPARSRQIYLQLQSTQPTLQIFLRHIQMQIRYKQFKNARTLYETLLTTFTANPDIIVIILQHYSELALKYFRDIIDVSHLLKSYFQGYPFHEGLFLTLLRHYKNNVELKEGTRESRQTLDQFTDLLVRGLSRALELVPDRYDHISKLARKIMREYVGSIYSVKTAERKIKEMEMQQRRVAQRQTYKRERQVQGQQ